MDPRLDSAGLLVLGGLALFWVGMLGLLWRRSLVGMLVGIFFGWLSVALVGVGFLGFRTTVVETSGGAVFVMGVVLACSLQISLGLSIVVARVARRGSLDAQDAELLEG